MFHLQIIFISSLNQVSAEFGVLVDDPEVFLDETYGTGNERTVWQLDEGGQMTIEMTNEIHASPWLLGDVARTRKQIGRGSKASARLLVDVLSIDQLDALQS